MARKFFAGEAAERLCSACSSPNPKYFDELTDKRFCDDYCFVEYFIENEARDYAIERSGDRLYEIH